MTAEATVHRGSRVVLVSGGSRGIGAEITRQLVHRKRRVACTYRSGLAEAQQLVDDAPERTVLPVPYELGDDSSAHAAIDKTVDEFGQIDAIILNAGLWAGGRLADTEMDQWWTVVDKNLRGTAGLTRAALPYLTASDSPSVVLVSSVVGVIGHAGDTAYSSAKAALIGFARSLAKEVARENIRVNVLAPGFVDTNMTSEVSPRARERIEQATIMRRFGTVAEIAAAAVFLSEDATFCTGTVLTADGGWSL